jgi:two-component system phosphate regulon sensor histidine kinase PhoR
MSYIAAATQTERITMSFSSATILQALDDAVVLVDCASLVQQINPAAAQMLGIAPEDIVGHSLGDLPGGTTLFEAADRAGEIEVDGRTLRFRMTPLLSDDDKRNLVGTMITFQDISAALLAKQVEYDYMARAVHDVRVPLQAIRGTAEGLLRGWFGPLTDDQREFVLSIKDNSIRQGDLFSDMFDVYTLSAGRVRLQHEALRLDELINEAGSQLAASCEARTIDLTIAIQDDLPLVRADRKRVPQILAALFDNACRFTLPGGRVEVHAGVDSGEVRVDVQDTGVGIRESELPRVFTPFFRGENPLKEGRYGGLHLAIAKMLVELHGGQIWFTSVEGQGSTFSFTLPVAEDSSIN